MVYPLAVVSPPSHQVLKGAPAYVIQRTPYEHGS